MRYLSVCSGIEAATVAWHPLGWTPVAFAEIEAFPSAVLQHHYPSVPNWGDMTRFKDWPDATVDVLVGGTPCQSFSVAGLRAGLADPRGNLALTYLAVADKYRPEWLVWENVPGVLSSGGGRDFGAFLGALGHLGYGWAYRVLDAQFFGLAQRRRRVFVVASARAWQRAAAVLFDSASLRGDSPPRREAGQDATHSTAPSLTASGRGVERTGESRGQDPVIAVTGTLASRTGGLGTDFDCDGGVIPALSLCLNAGGMGRIDGESETFVPVTHALRADGFDASEDGTGRGTPLVPIAFAELADPSAANQARTYTREGSHNFRLSNVAHTAMAVRRLTPRECERLQGFPDDYTLIPYCGKHAADGPRYKALGNSMAVPVMAWIGQRIAQVSEIADEDVA